jgi:hypothetical protein
MNFFYGEELTPIRNSGRIIPIKEVMRITDKEEDFFFKRPRNIKIAPDESIFMTDQDQFLHFDNKGKFLGNLKKQGEGPGEYINIKDYFFSKNIIIIYTFQPPKIIETDFRGNLIKEKRLKTKLVFLDVLTYENDKFWTFDSSSMDWGKAKTGKFDINKELCWNAKDDDTIHNTGLQFPEKVYMVKRESEGHVSVMVDTLIPTLVAFDREKYFFVSNSQQYQIKRVDLTNEVISGKFSRKYTRQPYQKEKLEEGARVLNPSPPEFFNDIQKLYFHNDQLWVLTSTVEKGKGVLVDLFSREGEYIDNFYLPLSQVETVHHLKHIVLTFHKNYFFLVEKDPDENSVVVKYQYQLL